ncbi:MAG: iron-sulfur cluster assembly scaffold protein [Acidobacteria bacterium]|nr:iron-sulfur cluster assembly scaffold protein [Acidobacteriota bacterium]
MPSKIPGQYGSRILEHFRNPRNTGVAADFSHRYLEQDNPWRIYILLTLRVEGGIISEIRFQAESCVTTVACVSALTEMVEGKSAEFALSITPEQLSESLGLVPAEKMHCCRLAIATLHQALRSPCSLEHDSKGETK